MLAIPIVAGGSAAAFGQSLFLRGEVYGTTHLYSGQEAVAVGFASVLRPEDRIACTYRGHGHALALGVDPQLLLDEMLGRESGINGGRAGSMNVNAPGDLWLARMDKTFRDRAPRVVEDIPGRPPGSYLVLEGLPPIHVTQGLGAGKKPVSAAPFAAFFQDREHLLDDAREFERSSVIDVKPQSPTADEKPREVFISYAWGDETPAGKIRTEAVSRWSLALVIAQAVAAICLWGTLIGSMLPLVFKRLGIDPGIASSPFVATFVDLTGIVIYFSIAKMLLL